MAEARVKKQLTRLLKELAPEIKEGLKYGVPHLVGEISGEDGEFRVELVVTVFEDAHHFLRLVCDGSLIFIFPAEDFHPYRLFMDLWRFLEGKFERKPVLEEGARIRGPIKLALQREGYEVLWMNVQMAGSSDVIQVWASRGGVRYNMTFEKIGENEFVLLEKKRIQ